MKKNYGLVTILAAFSLLLSCTMDDDPIGGNSSQDPASLSISEAKSYFNRNAAPISFLNQGNTSFSTKSGKWSAPRKITADWSKAQTYTLPNGIEAVQIPLNDGVKHYARRNFVENGQKLTERVSWYSHLLIQKSLDGNLSMMVSTVVPEIGYGARNPEKIKSFGLYEHGDLTGFIILSDLKGNFISGFCYKNGELDGTLTMPGKSDSHGHESCEGDCHGDCKCAPGECSCGSGSSCEPDGCKCSDAHNATEQSVSEGYAFYLCMHAGLPKVLTKYGSDCPEADESEMLGGSCSLCGLLHRNGSAYCSNCELPIYQCSGFCNNCKHKCHSGVSACGCLCRDNLSVGMKCSLCFHDFHSVGQCPLCFISTCSDTPPPPSKCSICNHNKHFMGDCSGCFNIVCRGGDGGGSSWCYYCNHDQHTPGECSECPYINCGAGKFCSICGHDKHKSNKCWQCPVLNNCR